MVAAVAATPPAAQAVEQGFIDVAVEGKGRVTGTQIDCPEESCRGRYFWPNDTVAPQVRLTASPGPGYAFGSWGGCFAVPGRPLECNATPHEEGSAVLARFVDVEAPTVTLTAPVDRHVVRPGVRLTATATVEDNGPLDRVVFHFAGVTAHIVSNAPWTTGFTVPATLAEGEHSLIARAYDQAGNTASSTRTFVVDATPPAVAFDGAAEVRTQDAFHDVRFTATDPHLSTVTCTVEAPDGTTVSTNTCSSGVRRISTPSVGRWRFGVLATDRAGHQTTTTLTVIREAVPDPDPNPDPGPGPQPGPGADPGAGPGPGTGSNTDPGPDASPGPGAGTGPLPGPAPLPGPPGGGPSQPKAPSTPQRCVVPKVARGSKLATARNRLTRAHCRVRTVRAKSRSVRTGRVIRISQKSGKKLPKGTRITVTVARR